MLFVCDLDGTLLDHTHDIDDVVMSGIKEVLAKGHYFAISTGRCMYDRSQINFGIEHDHMFTIALNGALVYDSSFEVIADRPIDKEIVATFLHDLDDVLVRYEAKDHGASPFTVERADAYLLEEGLYEEFDPHRHAHYLRNSRYGVKAADILAEDIYKINIILANSTLKEKADAALAKHSDKVVNAPWGEGFYDITDRRADKGTVAKYLADKLHIDYQDVHVYGDSYNDVGMLSMFSNSTCPSNANEAAKAAAKRIIGDYDDHSVIKDILAKI